MIRMNCTILQYGVWALHKKSSILFYFGVVVLFLFLLITLWMYKDMHFTGILNIYYILLYNMGRAMQKHVFRHTHSLIKAFTVHCQNCWILRNVRMETNSQDDTLHVPRMIWIWAFCTCLKALFHLPQTIYSQTSGLKPLWDHKNLFETAVVQATEGYY